MHLKLTSLQNNVQCLKLARHQNATSIQRINNVNTATHHSVFIHLRSRRTDWHTSFTCAVLPNITSNSPATKLDTTSWNSPKDILLWQALWQAERHWLAHSSKPVFWNFVVKPHQKWRSGCTKQQHDLKESDGIIACTLSAALACTSPAASPASHL